MCWPERGAPSGAGGFQPPKTRTSWQPQQPAEHRARPLLLSGEEKQTERVKDFVRGSPAVTGRVWTGFHAWALPSLPPALGRAFSAVHVRPARGTQPAEGDRVGRRAETKASSLPSHQPPHLDPWDWQHLGGWEGRRWEPQWSNPKNQKTALQRPQPAPCSVRPAMLGPVLGAGDSGEQRTAPALPVELMFPWGQTDRQQARQTQRRVC